MNKTLITLALLAAGAISSSEVYAQKGKAKVKHDPKAQIITTFDVLDVDSNGVVVAEEFFVYVKEVSFKQLDTNGDNRISYAEWLVEEAGEIGQELFERMDKNKDLKLTQAEFTSTPRMKELLTRLFHTLDRDGDKKLKKSELIDELD